MKMQAELHELRTRNNDIERSELQARVDLEQIRAKVREWSNN